MKNKLFNFLALTLTFFLLFSSVQPYALASETLIGTCGESVNWSFDSTDGKLTVNGTGAMEDYTSSSDVPWKDIKNNIFSVKIESGVTAIGEKAFANCTNLVSVNIADTVTKIGSDAFSHCDSMTAFTVPENVKRIDSAAFIDCDMLSELILCNGIESIGAYAFAYCPYLKSVSIPDTVTDIEDEIFYYCVQLETVHFGKGSPVVDMTAFVECNNLKSITVDPENPYMTADENGVLFNKDKTTLLAYPVGKEETSYVIPYGVKNIGLGAFNFAVNLVSVDMPETLETIGSNGFFACEKLTDIHIPDSVTHIGDIAFAGCYNLTSISLPTSLKSMGYRIFSSCEKLTSIFVPSNVTKFERFTFVLADSITDIYYDGDRNAWEGVTIENDNGSFPKATVHYEHKHTHELTAEKNASCEESGYKKYNCTVCPHRYTENIPEIGHKFGEYIPDEDALSETAVCSNNGCTKKLTREYHTTNSNKHGVSASYSPDCFSEEVALEVNEIKADREPGGVYMVEGKTYKQIGLFNIKTADANGNVVQPNEGFTVTIKIPIPDGYQNRTDFVVYHRFANGGREKLSTADGTMKIEKGFMIFEVSKFSEFEILLPAASAEITKLPNKTKYFYRSPNVDLSGIEMLITYPDSTTKTVDDTYDITVEGFDSNILGKQALTVRYEDCCVEIEIEIVYSWWQWIIRIMLFGFLWY